MNCPMLEKLHPGVVNKVFQEEGEEIEVEAEEEEEEEVLVSIKTTFYYYKDFGFNILRHVHCR